MLKSRANTGLTRDRADTSYRRLLPPDVEPEHYDLTLEPNLDTFGFDGNVKITVDVKVATDVITVHTKELLVGSAVFKPETGAAMNADEICTKVKDMTTAMTFDQMLPTGKGVLEITFKGYLNDQMAGFYRSAYTDSKGNKRHLATTQFEAIDARRCFPCWDEPGRKAVFTVTMIYDGTLTCVSNMPSCHSEILKDGRRKESFLPSPKMSTYLLAFCVGEFEFISGMTKGGVLARIMCCPGSIEKCRYALKCCTRCLDFYDEFFGIKYPLPKLDMIAIPDFAAGAMENWGLVTYREVALLCDEATVGAVQKQRICSVICHELAHQWFGNLVTMEWWDDLWLNEGFANWMQTYASDALHPEWKLWESYVGTDQQRALMLDALRSSHPIQVPICKAEEVEEVFDAISYSKGGSVVRMIYAVLGHEKFQEGLRLYFKRHNYANTETTDLWNAWAETSLKPMHDIMGTWTSQMGFPVVKVLNDPLESGGEIELEQSWFIADGSKQEMDEQKVWVIPILMGSDKGAAPLEFLDDKKMKISTGGIAAGAKYLKVNFGQQVPMRVMYPPSMLEKLAANVKSLSPEDRIGLLSDTYALCKNGAMQPISLIQLLNGYVGEDSHCVWDQLMAVLNGLGKLVTQGLDASSAEAFTKFASKLIVPAFELVGWEVKPTDSDNQRLLRNTLVMLLAKYCYRDAAVVAEAKKRFDAFIADPNNPAVLHADIRAPVLSIVMRAQGSDEIFDKLLEAHEKVTDGAIRIHIYSALGSSPTMALKKRGLALALTDTVRSQDMIYVPMHVAADGKDGADAVFNWMQEDYAKIYGRLGTTSMILFNSMVRTSGAGFVTADKAAEVDAFWKSKELYKMIQKTLTQTIEGILSNVQFVDRLKASQVALAAAWRAATA